jgi:hypothetical protein
MKLSKLERLPQLHMIDESLYLSTCKTTPHTNRKGVCREGYRCNWTDLRSSEKRIAMRKREQVNVNADDLTFTFGPKDFLNILHRT